MADQELAVVGSGSGLPLYKQYDAPFWNEKLPAASDGKITTSLTTHDQMGIQGGDIYHMLGMGVFDRQYQTALDRAGLVHLNAEKSAGSASYTHHLL